MQHKHPLKKEISARIIRHMNTHLMLYEAMILGMGVVLTVLDGQFSTITPQRLLAELSSLDRRFHKQPCERSS